MTSRRDAVTAGLIAGPLAMALAILFFTCMIAFYHGISAETLPSDLLNQLHLPSFHFLFQWMIFAALLESGTGSVHAINERIAAVWRARRGIELSPRARGLIAAALLISCIFIADRFGLVALIAKSYRALAYTFLAIYVVPLLTLGLRRLVRDGRPTRDPGRSLLETTDA